MSDEYCTTDGVRVWNDEMRQWIVAFSDERVSLQNSADAKFAKLLLSASVTDDKARSQSVLKEITGAMGATRNPALSAKVCMPS